MSLLDQYNLSQDVVFRQRVEVAACNAAIAIQAEATGTANHPNRAGYAKLVLNNPAVYGPFFTEAICANDGTLTIQNKASVTDAQIQTAVNSVYNALAGTV